MASGPAAGLELVDALTFDPSLEGYHLLASVRGDLLEKLGRFDEARTEFEPATSLTRNARERKLLLEHTAACGPESMPSCLGRPVRPATASRIGFGSPTKGPQLSRVVGSVRSGRGTFVASSQESWVAFAGSGAGLVITTPEAEVRQR